MALCTEQASKGSHARLFSLKPVYWVSWAVCSLYSNLLYFPWMSLAGSLIKIILIKDRFSTCLTHSFFQLKKNEVIPGQIWFIPRNSNTDLHSFHDYVYSFFPFLCKTIRTYTVFQLHFLSCILEFFFYKISAWMSVSHACMQQRRCLSFHTKWNLLLQHRTK